MPNINFPSSPTSGDQYSFSGVLYIFDGFIWIAQSGNIGPTGSVGSQGATGATGQGFNFTGNYSSIQNYSPYDVVTYQGSSFVSVVTSVPPHEPDIYPSYWGTLSEKGDTGATGSQGEIGATGSQGEIGATGPQGYASLIFGGVVSGATAWSSSNDGAMTLPNVIVGLYNNSEFLGDISTYSVIGGKTGTGSIPALANNDTNYVFIRYNGGSPIYDIDQTGSDINDSDVVRYMTVYRLNNFVHNLEFGNQGSGLPNKINNRILSVDRFARESGLAIGLSGSSGIVTLSSGVAWNGTFRQTLEGVNSTDDIFFTNYHVGGNWAYSTAGNLLNNTYYDNGTDIVSATIGKYLVNWYFRGQEINDHLYEVYHNIEYDNVASAQLSTPPELPELITSHAFLVGRVIVQVGTYSAIAETAFTTTFQSTSVISHNDLSNIQGGQPGEHYHLTSNQYTNMVISDGLQTVGQTLEWDGIYWKSVDIVGSTGPQGEIGPTGYFNGDVATFSQIKASFSYFGTQEVTPTSWVDIEGSNTSYSSLRMRSGIEPSLPNDGDVYYDGTHSYIRIGSIWSQLDNEPNDPNTIVVAKEGGQFTTIKDAVDSISGASASNTYVVKVRAGLYIEDPITMKSYVAIVGESSISTIIEANDPNQTLINLVDQSAVFDCQIQGCTGTGVAAVVYSSTTTPQTNAISYVENVRFGTNYTHAKVIGTASGNCIMQCSNVKYGGYPFTIGFYATNTGSGVGRMQLRNVTSTNGGISTTSGLIFAKTDAQSCGFIVNGCLLTKAVGTASGVGFQVENGGFLRLTGVNFQRWSKAIYVPTGTGSPSIDAIALNFENNTTDVEILNPNTTGKIQGPDNYLKTIISSTASIYIVNKDQRNIVVAKKGGDFTSVKSAIDSINDSSETNRYIISIGPGEFIEDEIDLSSKPYISVVGSNIQTTEISSSGGQNIFKLGIFNEISFLSLKNVDPGYSAILVDDGGDFSQVHKLSFYDCDVGISIKSTFVDTNFYGEYIDFNGTYTNAVRVESLGTASTFTNLENYYNFPLSESVSTFVSGPNATVDCLSSSNKGIGVNDIAFYIENGATLNLSGSNIDGYVTAIEVPNIGLPATFDIDGTSIRNCTTDLYIGNSSTVGTFQGSADHLKILNNSQSVNWVFLDHADGELDITRKLSVTFPDGTHTDLSTLLFEGSGMGVLSGGEISTVSGLTVSISSGYGYVKSSTPGIILKLEWNTSLQFITDNSSEYVYINENGILNISSGLPDIENNIVLGRVATYNGEVVFIDNTRVDSRHAVNKLNLFNRKALGSIYESGSIVTENVTPFHLNISGGSYYFGESNFLPSGGSDITFKEFYRNGTGGWVISSTNSITDKYDSNTGALITMSASYFTKHSLYVVGEGVDEQYLLVVGQTQYSNLVDAEDASLPTPPTYFEDGVTPISSIYVQQGTSTIYQIEDIRPVIGFKSSGVNASSLHGNLLGLSSDDHPQYLLVDGSRTLTGNLQMGSNSITGVSDINGVTIESHSSRHLPNGSDPLTTGTPSSIGTSNQEGILNAFARMDHIHDHGNQLGGSLHSVATSIDDGFLSSTDKQFIDSIPTTYLEVTGGTVSGKLHISGTVSASSISVSGTTSTTTLSISGRLVDQSGSSGSNGEILKSTATGSVWYPNKGSFGITVDGSGQDITTGEKGYVVLPYDGEITGWDIISGATCSCVFDLWKSTSIPTVANTITGSEKPTLTNQQKNNDYSLSTWTTLFSEGDIISFNVDSVTNCQRVTIIIKINKK